LLVKQMTLEADAVLAVVLSDPTDALLPGWEPGAHINILLDGAYERQFSLCGDVEDRLTYRLGILKEPASRGGTRYVHDHLRPGDFVSVSAPRNDFQLVESPRYLFIAGGIGIAPILPMLAQARAAAADYRLIYGGRRRSSMAFLGELRRYGDAAVVQPEDEIGLLDLDKILGRPDATTKIYCCGPERLLAAVEERCRLYSWPVDALRLERFRPKLQTDVVPAPAGAFKVVCQRSGLTVHVSADVSILTALTQAGVEVVSSCEEGVCGTCETRVLMGTPDHRDSVLTASERAAGGRMMICCSRALTERLVLDL
jgi:ferredoxin-NADP reductase